MSKRFVVPGELISEDSKNAGEHAYLQNGKIYAARLGFVSDKGPVVDVVPLEGQYKPKTRDVVIGIVMSEQFAGYTLDVGAFYNSFLSKKEFRYSLKKGDLVTARIDLVDEVGEAKIADVRGLKGGVILTISPVKVPRAIGKNGSMLEILKKGTNCNIVVGRNGRIWAENGDIPLLKKAVEKISQEAHLSNLTQAMEAFFKDNPAQLSNHTETNAGDE